MTSKSYLELCADVIMSATARRSILVGGDSELPVHEIGGGGKNTFFKGSRKISFYPKNFLMTFLVIDRKLQRNK